MADRKHFVIGKVYDEVAGLMDVLNEGSDLACVLISTSNLDVALVSLLQQHLIPGRTTAALLDSEGALGTLSSRADAAYCLGLISKPVYQNARVMCRVRNLFAHHHLALDFHDARVTELVRKLVLPSLAGGDPDGLVGRAAATPRRHFTIVAAGTVLLIVQLAHEVERRTPSSQGW